jgi:phage shock protein A
VDVRGFASLGADEGKWAAMSILCRLAALFRIKANKVLDRAEDPREVLDYSYSQQLEMLQKIRRGVADVATSRKGVELSRRAVPAGMAATLSPASPARTARQPLHRPLRSSQTRI